MPPRRYMPATLPRSIFAAHALRHGAMRAAHADGLRRYALMLMLDAADGVMRGSAQRVMFFRASDALCFDAARCARAPTLLMLRRHYACYAEARHAAYAAAL